jgi:hypothetical protein
LHHLRGLAQIINLYRHTKTFPPPQPTEIACVNRQKYLRKLDDLTISFSNNLNLLPGL